MGVSPHEDGWRQLFILLGLIIDSSLGYGLSRKQSG